MSKQNNKLIMKVWRVTEGAFYVRIEHFAAGGDMFVLSGLCIIPSFFFRFCLAVVRRKSLVRIAYMLVSSLK